MVLYGRALQEVGLGRPAGVWCLSDVCMWPKCEVPTGPGNVCCLGQTRHIADITKSTRLTRSGRLATIGGALSPKRTYGRSPGQAFGTGRRLCPTCQERMPAGSNYCFGTGIGRMLETFQPSAVLRRTWFIRNVVVCAG